MDAINSIATAFNSSLLMSGILMPAFLCLVMYVVYRKRDELTRHAIQNTAATLVVAFMNFGVALLFYKDINRFLQRIYDSLGIPTLPETVWDGWPLVLVAIIGIVVKDFADYWNHRLMHTEWGWPTHAAHHSDTHVNAFTTYRVHFFEAIVMSGSYIVLLTWLQMPKAIPIVVMFGAIHNMYVHMNLQYAHGPFKYLLASPAFHRWHHADVEEAYGKNLANIMPLWDRLFGTWYYPGLCEDEMGAKKTGVEDKNPFLIFAYPILEWSRMVRTKLVPALRTKQDASPKEAHSGP